MTKGNKNELGELLEKLRGKMTLREAAAKSGLSHTYIRDLEFGLNRKTKAPINPTPETLKRLSEAYNYPYDKLMTIAGYTLKEGKELSSLFILSQMKQQSEQLEAEQKQKILSEIEDWKELIGEEELNIELSDEDLLKNYNFTYKGKKLDTEKAQQIINFIKFVSDQD